MGERMYAVISRWIWFLPGGLIHTNIVSCATFVACSGSSVATSATISRAALPSFRQRNYSEKMVIGSLAAGGTLGILIPPSIGLILFGVLAEESIGRLYIAGFIPGLLLSVIFMLMIGIMAVFLARHGPTGNGRELHQQGELEDTTRKLPAPAAGAGPHFHRTGSYLSRCRRAKRGGGLRRMRGLHPSDYCSTPMN